MDAFAALRAIGALILVLGMLLGSFWLMRRYGAKIGLKAGTAASDLRILEWRNLDLRRKLAVVRWGDKEHLLCLSPGGDIVVGTRDAVDPPKFTPTKPDAP